MSILTLLLYVVVLGLWVWCVHREGGIGIGVRFMFAFSMVQQFLVGPPLYVLSGLAESEFEYRNREQAVQLVLYCLLGFLVVAYLLTPLLVREPVLRMETAWKPFAHPQRLETASFAERLKKIPLPDEEPETESTDEKRFSLIEVD